MKLKVKSQTKEQTLSITDGSFLHRYDRPIPTFANMVRQLNK